MKKKKRNPAPRALPADLRTLPLHDKITTQAHLLWNHYGQPAGNDIDIWLEAERQVLGVDTEGNQQADGPGRRGSRRYLDP